MTCHTHVTQRGQWRGRISSWTRDQRSTNCNATKHARAKFVMGAGTAESRTTKSKNGELCVVRRRYGCRRIVNKNSADVHRGPPSEVSRKELTARKQRQPILYTTHAGVSMRQETYFFSRSVYFFLIHINIQREREREVGPKF